MLGHLIDGLTNDNPFSECDVSCLFHAPLLLWSLIQPHSVGRHFYMLEFQLAARNIIANLSLFIIVSVRFLSSIGICSIIESKNIRKSKFLRIRGINVINMYSKFHWDRKGEKHLKLGANKGH